MSFERLGASTRSEDLCRYGSSRIMCRGPAHDLSPPYFVFLGEGETFGRFVKMPFPTLVAEITGHSCVNLACANGGVDTYLHDPDLLGIARRAERAVVQVMGAQNLSNRYFRVHPRRNDRFVEPTILLVKAFPEADFSEINFNKHLLQTLYRISPRRCNLVVEELKLTWVERMRALLRGFERRPLLLWLRYDNTREDGDRTGLGPNPLLVDRKLIQKLGDDAAELVEIKVKPAGATGEMDRMSFGPLETPAAAHLIGPRFHGRIATRLSAVFPPGPE
ncbi:MAG: DUF6473 family protein [Pseudomonadota bacterium]|nr:DUF6473 family protein [Pseudomonadota bacterium]